MPIMKRYTNQDLLDPQDQFGDDPVKLTSVIVSTHFGKIALHFGVYRKDNIGTKSDTIVCRDPGPALINEVLGVMNDTQAIRATHLDDHFMVQVSFYDAFATKTPALVSMFEIMNRLQEKGLLS